MVNRVSLRNVGRNTENF